MTEYEPLNLLITGGCGFIGSNFINFYKNKYPNISIYNFDKIDYCSNKYNINHDKLIIGNLTNAELLLSVIETYNIDTVVHFAAQTHVDNSFENSLQFTTDNIIGTHTLLECCKKYGKIKRFIHISTDEVYGEIDINASGSTENSILNPTNPYAATKAGAEMIARSYYYSFNLPIIITRGNNVFGPRQYPEKLIPKFITLLLNNKKCTIQGTGIARRNFIFIDDVTNALDIIIKNGVINNIYNIGTNNEYSVMDITKKIINIIKPNDNTDDWIDYIDDRKYNDFRYFVNSNELTKIGWKENADFESSLLKTIDYYKK